MKTYKLEVALSENAENPRMWDNFAKLVCFHRRYDLGDKHNYKFDDYESWEEVEEAIRNEHNVIAMAPLYLYDHSGITIATKPFGCRWDSGRVGVAYVTKEQLEYIGGFEENAQEYLEAEVKTYDSYIRGEVYDYSIIEVETCNLGCEHDNVVESCGGYYTEEEALEQGNLMLAYYTKQAVES